MSCQQTSCTSRHVGWPDQLSQLIKDQSDFFDYSSLSGFWLSPFIICGSGHEVCDGITRLKSSPPFGKRIFEYKAGRTQVLTHTWTSSQSQKNVPCFVLQANCFFFSSKLFFVKVSNAPLYGLHCYLVDLLVSPSQLTSQQIVTHFRRLEDNYLHYPHSCRATLFCVW